MPSKENSPAPIIPPIPRAVAEKRLIPLFFLLEVLSRLGFNLENGLGSVVERQNPIFRLLRVTLSYLVPRKGLEPPQPYDRQHLKLVRLPISPPGHATIIGGVPFEGISELIWLFPCRLDGLIQ